MAISMMIPIPLTNTAPAAGVFVTSFGLQEDDGFITLAGLIICLIAGLMSTTIIIIAVGAISLAIENGDTLWQAITNLDKEVLKEQFKEILPF